MKVYAAILSAAVLTGCASASVPPPTVIKVPVPVACVSADFPKAPTYPDTREALRQAPDQAEFTRLLAAGWPLRDARLKALEAAVDACRTLPPK